MQTAAQRRAAVTRLGYRAMSEINRVTSVTVNGQPLDSGKTYKVAMNNFTAGGGDGFTMFKDAKRLDTGTLDVDILVNYLKANPTLDAQNEGRIIIVNEPKK